MQIYQASNESLVFNLSGGFENFTDFYAVLTLGSKKLKAWELVDVDVVDNKLILPLKQEETSNFTVGDATLSMKCFNSDNQVEFASEIDVEIVERKDKTKIF